MDTLAKDKLFQSLFEAQHDFVFESTDLFIRYYLNKCSFLYQSIMTHKKYEPFKIFKKTHQKWEKEKNELSEKLEEALQKLEEEYANYKELTDVEKFLS